MSASKFKARASYETRPGERPGSLARTYRLHAHTVKRIDELCERRGWYPSDLVQLLVADGLDRLASGDLQIVERPVMFEIHAENRTE